MTMASVSSLVSALIISSWLMLGLSGICGTGYTSGSGLVYPDIVPKAIHGHYHTMVTFQQHSR